MIAAALDVHPATVVRVRRQYVVAGLDAALTPKTPTRAYRRRLDGAQEAQLVALACSTPPAGRARWTRRRLADRLVALEQVDAISHETVRQTVQQPSSSRG